MHMIVNTKPRRMNMFHNNQFGMTTGNATDVRSALVCTVDILVTRPSRKLDSFGGYVGSISDFLDQA